MAFQKVGVRAVIEGLGAFNRDARLINKRLAEVTRNTKELEKATALQAKRQRALAKSFRVVGLALTALGAVGTAFLFKATKLAARVETLGVVTEVLGKNIGKTKDEIRGLEKAVTDQGITLQTARKSIALMIQSNVDLAHAVDLAAEAQNAAVIAGVDSSEAFQRLVFVITSGNVRMARTLGLQVRFQDAYKKLAVTLGKTSIELTEQERVAARTNAVLKAGERIVGAYDAAMETAGKKMFSLNRHIEEATRIMGKLFLPLFADAVDLLTEFLEGIEEATEAQQRGIAATVASTTAIAGLSGATLIFLSLLPNLIAGLKLLGIATLGAAGAIGAIVAVLGVLVTGFAKAAVENKSLEKTFEDLDETIFKSSDSFEEYEKQAFEAAEGTNAFKEAQSQAAIGGADFDDVLRVNLRNLGLLTEEEFEAAQQAFRAAAAHDALQGALRGVGTSLQDQITDLKISEISFKDYTEQVEALAKANDLTVVTQQDFVDAIKQGLNPLEILEKSVLQASEKQFDLAKSAEASDRKLLGLLATERDAATETSILAEKLGLTEEELLKVAEAAGIAIEGLDELPEDIEIKIQAVLDERVQENIQFQLDKLELQISTTVGADFTEFKEELGGLEQTIEDIEIERIEAIAELEAEGVEDVEELADGVRNLNRRRDDAIIRLKEMRNRLELAREQMQGMGADTDELARKSKELAIERLVNDIKSQERAVADLRGELGELSGTSSDLAAQQEQDLTDLNVVYDDKLGAAREKIEETTKAWSDQTKEILFNLATQQLALGGFTGEELQLLRKLAGPEGLGLIDEAGVALLEFFDDVNMTLQAPGNQVPEVEAAMEAVFQAMVDPEQRIEQLVDKISDIGRAVRDVALEPRLRDLIERGLIPAVTLPGRQQGGSVRRGQPYEVGETGRELFVPNQSGVILPSSLTSAITSYLTAATSAIPIAGAGAPASAAGGGGTTQNYNMTVNTNAPVEPIVADFNLLALMGERRA